MTQLSQEQAVQLFQTLTAGGVDCTALKASNPFLPEFAKTPRGREIRVICEAVNPQLATDLKRAAGDASAQQSLAMVAALASKADPQSFTGALAEEWRAINPDAQREAQEEADAALLAKLDRMTEASRRKREGDKAYDDRLAREQSAQVEAERRRAEGEALDARIRAKQQAIHNDLRIAAGNAVIPAE